MVINIGSLFLLKTIHEKLKKDKEKWTLVGVIQIICLLFSIIACDYDVLNSDTEKDPTNLLSAMTLNIIC